MIKKLYSKIQEKVYKAYTSNDYLPIWNFFQVLKTNDYRFLLKLNDYEKLPNIRFSLAKSWNKIYSEFLNKTDNQQWTVQLLIQEHIERLRSDFYIITRMCVYLLCDDNLKKKEEYENYLKDKGYRIDDSDYINSIIAILNSAKGIEKKIELKKLELKQPEQEQSLSIDDMLGLMFLQTGVLNLKEISVNQFIGIKNALEKKNKVNKPK